MKRLLLGLLCACLCSITALHAQQLKGRVVQAGATPKPVSYVSVSVTDESKKLLGGAFTNDEGYFVIALPEGALLRRLKITCTHLSYQKQEVEGMGQELQGSTITLVPRSEQLKEVVVRSHPVRKRGDTIRYNVGQLLKLGDHTLEDALKRIPGMVVGKNGQIQYQGKDINQFYIEGLDLLGGRYSLATRNIKADDVASVDVLENHEPVKLRKDISHSDQAALNIRLKDKAKNLWIYALTTGAGIDQNKQLLGMAEGSAYSVGKQAQTMIIAKGNNMGNDIMTELSSFGVASGVVRAKRGLKGAQDIFETSAEIGDAVVQDRGRFNTSALASINHVRRRGEDAQWRLSSNYGYDKAQRRYDHTTLWQSDPLHRDTIYDSTAFDRIEHAANIESHYTYNAAQQYGSLLTEAIFARKNIEGARALGVHSKRYGDTTTAPSFTMDNKIDWQWKHPSGAIVHLLNNTILEHLPQEYLLRELRNDLVAHQEATKRLLQNELILSYERRKGRLEYKLELQSELKQQGLEGALYFPKLTTEASQLTGKLTMGHYSMVLKPSLTYRLHGWRLTASPRVVGLYQSTAGSGSAYGDQRSWVYLFEPMGSVRYEGRRFDTSLYALLRHRHQPLESLYAPYLFMSVDNVLTGSPALEGEPWWRSRQLVASLSSTYKDIFALFSAVYNASYTQSLTPRGTSNHLYEGSFYVRNYVARPMRDASWVHSLSLDKTFLSAGLSTRIKLEHSLFTSEVLQQGHTYQGHGAGYSLHPEVEWQALEWFSLAFRGALALSDYTPDRDMPLRRQLTQQHTLTMYAKPSQALTLRASAHYYNMRGFDGAAPAPRDFVVGDLRAEYSLPFATAIVDLRNVGSSGVYEVLQQSSLNSSFSTYRLRRPELLLTLRWKFPSKK